MKTSVKLREEDIFIEVNITDVDKPILTSLMEEKWQRIINIIAKLLEVPSGLIMKITKDSMQVFIKSDNEMNPYKVAGSDTLGHGLYCETVIGKDQELLIDNALKYEKWKDNPDVALDMTAYYGLPLKWPDETFFGTLCVLDNKENAFSDIYKELMKEFKGSIENDLELLVNNNELEFLANYDMLTMVYNRRKMKTSLEEEFKRYKRFTKDYSVVLIDLDNFKSVNDNYGHEVGDQVLTLFADLVQKHTREVDIFGRWGGDEFLLLCPETNREGTLLLMEKLYSIALEQLNAVAKELGVSYGIAVINDNIKNSDELIKLADDSMYEMKSEHKQKKKNI